MVEHGNTRYISLMVFDRTVGVEIVPLLSGSSLTPIATRLHHPTWYVAATCLTQKLAPSNTVRCRCSVRATCYSDQGE